MNYRIRHRVENRYRIIELEKNASAYSATDAVVYTLYINQWLNYELYPSIDILKPLISEV